MEDINGSNYRQADSALGWKAIVGLRPVTFLGVEADYIDYGNTGDLHTRADAIGVCAVGYLPIPPVVDIFAKAGWARTYTIDEVPVNDPLGPYSINVDHRDSQFAYGVGMRWKVRSLGITWTF